MEQHPVPRNISGFQFHLIGDMTIRQFAYLAIGVVCGYFIFKTAPFSAVVNIPLALTFGFVGFAFAFLPIQERPLDKWILAFIKSIMSPTQYLWYKNNAPPDIFTRPIVLHALNTQVTNQSQRHRETNEKLRAYLATVPIPIHESLNAAEKRYIDKTLSLFQTTTAASSQPVKSAINTPTSSSVIQNPPPVQTKPANQPPVPQKEIPKEIQPEIQTVIAPVPIKIPPEPLEDHSELKTQLSQLAAEKLALEKQLQQLQQQLNNVNTPKVVKPILASDTEEKPPVKIVNPKPQASEIGVLNISQTPNLMAGIIKDPQRKLLPNIILTIKDKSGLPVRALKTNKLGQFSTATPLPNGTYHLEVEDPLKRYVFDVTEISLSGKIFLPIEIVAKGEKELNREKLTKELFGNQTL